MSKNPDSLPLRVQGGARLQGEVSVSGAKNSALKLMALSLLATGTTEITNVPAILDVSTMAELLIRLGCQVPISSDSVSITVPERPDHRADYDLVRKMRASINVLGPLVARCGEAEVALPGGDAIGKEHVPAGFVISRLALAAYAIAAANRCTSSTGTSGPRARIALASL